MAKVDGVEWVREFVFARRARRVLADAERIVELAARTSPPTERTP